MEFIAQTDHTPHTDRQASNPATVCTPIIARGGETAEIAREILQIYEQMNGIEGEIRDFFGRYPSR